MKRPIRPNKPAKPVKPTKMIEGPNIATYYGSEDRTLSTILADLGIILNDLNPSKLILGVTGDSYNGELVASYGTKRSINYNYDNQLKYYERQKKKYSEKLKIYKVRMAEYEKLLPPYLQWKTEQEKANKQKEAKRLRKELAQIEKELS